MNEAARRLTPELLDSLPADAPAANRSRRDLRIINRLMNNAQWIRRALRRSISPDEKLIELGAGSGESGWGLIDANVNYAPAGIDLAPCPEKWPDHCEWFQSSILTFDRWHEWPVVIGNLIFHHFTDAQLATLGAQLNQHARVIIASEPLRVKRAQRLFALLCPLINADPVTRHDGVVSIEAGFRGNELPALLGLDPERWSWRCEETFLGASRMIATRRPSH